MLFRLLGEPYSFFFFLPLEVINGVKSSYKNKKKPKKGKDQVTELCMGRLSENLESLKQPKLPEALPLDPTKLNPS